MLASEIMIFNHIQLKNFFIQLSELTLCFKNKVVSLIACDRIFAQLSKVNEKPHFKEFLANAYENEERVIQELRYI